MTLQDAPPRRPPGTKRPELDAESFARIAAIAHKEAGLAIAPAKMAMVHTRLARRLRELRLASYPEYCTLVESSAGKAERREMISALTTNVSHFFRESHHFDRLRQDILPDMVRRLKNGERLRFWSAGCSNGQEPYSIAITLLEEMGEPTGADIRILATDIDPKVIEFARAGLYDQRMISGLSEDLRARYFTQITKDGHALWQASEKTRSLVSFRELNLLHEWPMKGQFDVIFCRNVVIYFDEATQQALWKRFTETLSPGGWLFLGHSERVPDQFLEALQPAGMTTYRRGNAKSPSYRKSPEERNENGPS